MRKIIVTAAALVAATFAGTALADDAPESGLEIGARLGYGIPLGNATGAPSGGTATALSDTFSSMIPIQIDALYMINPNIRVGAYFQYGFLGIPDKITECKQNGVSCSAHDIRVGAQAHYHFMPSNQIDPWAGIGIGYESASLSASANGQSASTSVSGFEFLNIQGGADYKVMPNLGVGPFVMLTLSQYSSLSSDTPGAPSSIDNKSLHEWLILGVRGDYEIGF